MKTRNRQTLIAAVLRAGLIVAVIAIAAGLVAVTSLRWVDPVTSSIIFQSNFTDEAPLPGKKEDGRRISFTWRPLEQISQQMAVAVIAAEDQRFLRHHGIDFVEISKTLGNTLRNGTSRPRGASTITQQTAKNLFLWGGRSYPRKLLEAVLAIYIDLVWGKRRVLEIYMNIVQFGPNIYGVENASQHFFGKPAARLNRHEAARLAAVLPNPNHRSATAASPRVLERQRWILRQMRAIGGTRVTADLRQFGASAAANSRSKKRPE